MCLKYNQLCKLKFVQLTLFIHSTNSCQPKYHTKLREPEDFFRQVKQCIYS